MNQEPKRSFSRWLIAGPIIVVLLLVGTVLVLAIMDAREAVRRGGSKSNLAGLGLALHNYHSVHGHLPPAVVYGPDGKTPHSWRVAILPYLEQGHLYDQYRLDEPWDSEHNKQLIKKIPPRYQNPNDNGPIGNTGYFAIVGADTMFPSDGRRMTLSDIPDGTSNTIAFVEAKRNVPWTKPVDIPYDVDKPLPKLGGFHPGIIQYATGSGGVEAIREDVGEEVLRRLIVISDGKADDAE